MGVVESDSQPRFSQDELVPRPEADPKRPRRNRHGAAVANHARAVRAPVVAQAIPSGGRLEGDMGVPAGHALVDLSRSFDERHLVRPYQAVARVSDLGAASEVDAFSGKRVGFSFGRAAHHRQVDAGEGRFAPSLFRGRTRDASKGESELGTLGECIVRAAPTESWALLRTDAASAAEATAFKAIGPGMKTCVRNGLIVQMPAFFMRRLTTQRAVM